MLDVVLCVENRIYREGLKQLLSANPAVGSVRECCLASRALGAGDHREREAILIDITADVCRECHDRTLRTAFDLADGRPVIALGLSRSDDDLLAAVAAGAAACVTVDEGIDRLVEVLIATLDGALVCPPQLVRRLQTQFLQSGVPLAEAERIRSLSQREHQVLGLLEKHMSNKLIARQLGLEVSTIKNHVHNIIVKLAVKNRLQAGEIGRTARSAGLTA